MFFIPLSYLATIMRYAQSASGRFWRDEAGASLVEYAILVALIALVAIAAVQALGTGIARVFQNILGRIEGLGR